MTSKRRASLSYPRRRLSSLRHQLCRHCSEADFAAIFSSLAPGASRYEETFIVNSSTKFSDDSCVFCNFLVCMGIFDSSASGVYQLHLSRTGFKHFPLLKALGVDAFKIRCQDSFSGHRYLVSQPDSRSPVRTVKSDHVDYGIIKDGCRSARTFIPTDASPRFLRFRACNLLTATRRHLFQLRITSMWP